MLRVTNALIHHGVPHSAREAGEGRTAAQTAYGAVQTLARVRDIGVLAGRARRTGSDGRGCLLIGLAFVATAIVGVARQTGCALGREVISACGAGVLADFDAPE